MNQLLNQARNTLLALLVIFTSLGMAPRAGAQEEEEPAPEAEAEAEAEPEPDKGEKKIDPVDAASLANDINQDHCVDAYASDIAVAAESTKAVLDAWKDVDTSYKQHHENYLLFWRGVLAQCLGRNDTAGDDLQQFVRVQSARGGFHDLIQQANNRLKRLGYAKERGIGPAGEYLQGHQIVEGSIAYAGGLNVHLQYCTNVPDHLYGGSMLDSACLGEERPTYFSGLSGQPLGLHAAVAIYPLRFLGLGGRFNAGFPGTVQLTAPEAGASPTDLVLPSERSIGPLWRLFAGPIVRIQPSIAQGTRGIRLQLMPSLLVRSEEFTPIAGFFTTTTNKETDLVPGVIDTQMLDAGTFTWTRYGAALWMELAVEIKTTAVFRIGGSGGACLNNRNPSLGYSSQLSESEWEASWEKVPMMPEAETLTSGFAGVHLGWLAFGRKEGIAVEPTIHLGWSFSSLSYAYNVAWDMPKHTDRDDQKYYWNGGWKDADAVKYNEDNPDEEPIQEFRKVYSTRQDRFTVMFEIGIRFGASKKK